MSTDSPTNSYKEEPTWVQRMIVSMSTSYCYSSNFEEPKEIDKRDNLLPNDSVSSGLFGQKNLGQEHVFDINAVLQNTMLQRRPSIDLYSDSEGSTSSRKDSVFSNHESSTNFYVRSRYLTEILADKVHYFTPFIS